MVLDRSTEALLSRVATATSTQADAERLRGLLLGCRSGPRGLTDEQVHDMRVTWARWCAAGMAGISGGRYADRKGWAELGLIWGVSAGTARNICTGMSYATVGGPIHRAGCTAPGISSATLEAVEAELAAGRPLLHIALERGIAYTSLWRALRVRARDAADGGSHDSP